MVVKKHLMKYDKEGNLIDDEDEEVKEKESSEKEFAKSFTENYDNISKKFPIFNRLKALNKISASLLLIQHLYNSIKESSVKNEVDSLIHLKNQIKTYPNYTETIILTEYNKLIVAQGLVGKIISNELDIKNDLRTQFRNADSNLLTQICQILNEQFKINLSRDDVHNWLITGDYSKIHQKILDAKRDQFKIFEKGLTNISLKKDVVKSNTTIT